MQQFGHQSGGWGWQSIHPPESESVNVPCAVKCFESGRWDRKAQYKCTPFTIYFTNPSRSTHLSTRRAKKDPATLSQQLLRGLNRTASANLWQVHVSALAHCQEIPHNDIFKAESEYESENLNLFWNHCNRSARSLADVKSVILCSLCTSVSEAAMTAACNAAAVSRSPLRCR